jgi:energy-coupling factor transport system substrate-specific component
MTISPELASYTLLALALAAGFAWYERSHPSSKVLALVATLAALAALGRVAFAPLPNVKPTTDIVLLSGFALGGAPGFVVGAVGALASNVFFGQGPWTPWQMGAWGLVGVAGAALGAVSGRRMGRVPLALACGAAGLAYGAILDFSTWVTFTGEQTLGQYLAISGAALPFNLAHAIGNVVFCLAFGPAVVRALLRFRARFEVRWEPAPLTASACVLVALLAVGAAVARPAPAAAADRATARAAAYLARAQNADGGFGAALRARSTPLYTGWAAMGLSAAGRRPARIPRDRTSVAGYLSRSAAGARRTGDVERTILALVAWGLEPRRSGGADLVARLRGRDRRDGSFGGLVNLTAFGVLALRAAGDPGLRAHGAPRRRLDRPPAEPRRRLRLLAPRRPERDRRHRGRGPGAGGRRAPGQRRRPPRGGVPRPVAEPRRRPAAHAGSRVQRAVHGVGGPGADRRRAQPRSGPPRRLAHAAGVPAHAGRLRRRGALLAHEPPDAGLGHGPGLDRPRAPPVPHQAAPITVTPPAGRFG